MRQGSVWLEAVPSQALLGVPAQVGRVPWLGGTAPMDWSTLDLPVAQGDQTLPWLQGLHPPCSGS